jgi:hypothetical protein
MRLTRLLEEFPATCIVVLSSPDSTEKLIGFLDLIKVKTKP